MTTNFKVSELTDLGRVPRDNDLLVINNCDNPADQFTRNVTFGNMATEIINRIGSLEGGAFGEPIWYIPMIKTSKGGTAEGPTFKRSFGNWADSRENDYGVPSIATSGNHDTINMPNGEKQCLMIYSTMHGVRHSDFIRQHPGWSRGLAIDIRSYATFTQHLTNATFESGRANAQSSTLCWNLPTSMHDSTIAVVGGNYNRFANGRITKINLINCPSGSFNIRTVIDLTKGGWNHTTVGMGRYMFLPVADIDILKTYSGLFNQDEGQDFMFTVPEGAGYGIADEDAERMEAIQEYLGVETDSEIALMRGNLLRGEMLETITKINLYIDEELEQNVPDTSKVDALKAARTQVYELQDNTGTYEQINQALESIVSNVTALDGVGPRRFQFELDAGVPEAATAENHPFELF